jgi:hypothetical protein
MSPFNKFSPKKNIRISTDQSIMQDGSCSDMELFFGYILILQLTTAVSYALTIHMHLVTTQCITEQPLTFPTYLTMVLTHFTLGELVNPGLPATVNQQPPAHHEG